MSSNVKNFDKESHTQIITDIHGALDKEDFDTVLDIVGQIGSNPELEDIGQTFLLTYHYNFKTRFYEKADFNYCMKFSDILNKRQH